MDALLRHIGRKIEHNRRRKEEFKRVQGSLFDTPIVPVKKRATLAEEFEAFDRANPQVWDEIKRRAMELVASGARRIGMKMLYEAIRYDYTVRTNGGEFKLNNNYTAFYARKLAAQVWMPLGMIELRERRTK